MAPQATGAGYRTYPAGSWPLSRFFLIVVVVLFILASFAAGGHEIADIPWLTWALAGVAAYFLSWVVP